MTICLFPLFCFETILIFLNSSEDSDQLVRTLKLEQKWLSTSKLKARSEALCQNVSK
jgi:hypothetical protein